jgi:DNA-binding HxlR family transcriptional regulator
MNQSIADVNSKLNTGIVAVNDGIASDCPVRDVVSGISGKWSLFLMCALGERKYRFGELRRLFPDISQRMLTQTLHDLQREGYVHRDVLPTNPPSVEYSLTRLGSSLFAQLRFVLQWASQNQRAVHEARAAFRRV